MSHLDEKCRLSTGQRPREGRREGGRDTLRRAAGPVASNNTL